MLATSDALARWLTKPGGPRVGPIARRDRCYPECVARAHRVTRAAPVGCVARGAPRAFLPTRADRAGAVCAGARHASEPIASRRGDVVRAGARGDRESGQPGASDDGAAVAAPLAVLGAAARTKGERRGDVPPRERASGASSDVSERNESKRGDGRRRKQRRSGSRDGSKSSREKKGGENVSPTRPNPNPKPKPKPRAKRDSPEGDRAGFDDDGGWRRRSKSALQGDIARYVDVATAALEAERLAEASAAAAMSQSEANDDASASAVDRDVHEGTIVGRAGAMMDGLRLTSARPSPVKGWRLLNLRVEGRGARCPPALWRWATAWPPSSLTTATAATTTRASSR